MHVLPLTGKPEQQRFTMRSGVLTSISSRQRSAISGRPLSERTDYGPTVCSLLRLLKTYLCFCHSTQVNTPILNPSQTARGTRLTYPGAMEGWFTRPQTVTHPSTNGAVHGRELNSQPVAHQSDALTTTPPSQPELSCIATVMGWVGLATILPSHLSVINGLLTAEVETL